MVKFQDDDSLLVGREGVDYKVSYKDFSDGLVDLSPYAKLADPSQLITAKEFIGDGSKLTNLPGGGSISEVLAEGNTADPAQTLRFRISADDVINPDDLDQPPSEDEITEGLGSVHRGLASSYNCYGDLDDIDDAGIYHSNVNPLGFYNRITGADGYDYGQAAFSTRNGIQLYSEAWGQDFGFHAKDDYLRYYTNGTELRVTKNDIEFGADRSSTLNVAIDDLKVTAENYSVIAKEFIGDGSKLTNLPGAAVGVNEVLAEGNTANPGQSLHFKVKAGDLPPFAKDSIDVDAGSGLRLGGLVSYYTVNESFTIDTDHGATDFARSQRRISAVDDYYFAEHPKGGSISAAMGVMGIAYSGDDARFDIGGGTARIRLGDDDAPLLEIEARTYDGKSSITAGEFIGDGSKLTNLPVADVNLSEYARLDGADFTGEVTVDAECSFKRIKVVDDVKGGRPPEFSTFWKNAVNIECNQGDSDNGFKYRAYNADKSARIEIRSGDDGIALRDTSIDDDIKVSITPQGSVTAKEFIGDGSKLTNLPVADVDAYTKDESNARFLPLDIRNLPELS